MKNSIVFLIVFLICNSMCFTNKSIAQVNFQWAKNSGGTLDDEAYSVAVDSNGNSYVAGMYYSSSITFGAFTLTNAVSNGASDIFIVKYDVNGNIIWAKGGGGIANDNANSITVDINGYIYVTGSFAKSLIFGDDTLYSTKPYGVDIFIVKFDSNGNLIWAKNAGGKQEDIGKSISTDKNGNVYVTGYFNSAIIKFDSLSLNKNSTSNNKNMFVVKYDSNGNAIWASCGIVEDTDYDAEANSIVIDNNFNTYVTGFFNGHSLTLGTIKLENVDYLYKNIYIVKYDINGNVVWAHNAGGDKDAVVNSIGINSNDEILITGNFFCTNIKFDTIKLTNKNTNFTNDIFLVKYNTNGNVVWANSFGGTSHDRPSYLHIDANDYIYITGYFYSPELKFGTFTLFNNSNMFYSDLFIAKFDNNGLIHSASNIGSIGYDESNSIVVDKFGNIYITGYFASPYVDFGSIRLINSMTPRKDMFIAKLSIAANIEENSNINEFKVYPNPFSDFTNVQFKNEYINSILNIYDITGKLVKKITIDNTNTLIYKDWLKNGLYYSILIKNGICIASGKLIIQN